MSPGEVVARLAAAGCVAAEEEATELVAAAPDAAALERMVARRAGGEPLAWIVGWTTFCGLRVNVGPGVYVPRRHTEALARRAASRLPPGGVAVDLCTGSGAVACWIRAQDPAATVLAADMDPVAVACARGNGVDTLVGDLDGPLPRRLLGTVDILTAVAPYVPTRALPFLPRDVLAYEPPSALNGGDEGLRVVRRVVAAASRWLRPGGWLLLELGGDQAGPVTAAMEAAGFTDVDVLRDEEGDDRGIEGRRGA